jgi:gentisate 1,2-dioxygenase
MIKPGETARAHRHSASALRIILDGRGTYTVVDGVRLEMRPGDVLLTPGGCWHEHSATGQDDCYWVDVLDVPLVHLLETMFFENYPTWTQPDPVDLEDAPGAAFRWQESVRRLTDQVAPPADGMAEREIELTAIDGGSAMATMAVFVQWLSAGFVTASARTTASSVFVVLEGAGRTTVDGQVLNWQRGDVVAAPLWRAYQHEADSDSYLVRVTDLPVVSKLGLFRWEQVEGRTC